MKVTNNRSSVSSIIRRTIYQNCWAILARFWTSINIFFKIIAFWSSRRYMRNRNMRCFIGSCGLVGNSFRKFISVWIFWLSMRLMLWGLGCWPKLDKPPIVRKVLWNQRALWKSIWTWTMAMIILWWRIPKQWRNRKLWLSQLYLAIKDRLSNKIRR